MTRLYMHTQDGNLQIYIILHWYCQTLLTYIFLAVRIMRYHGGSHCNLPKSIIVIEKVINGEIGNQI